MSGSSKRLHEEQACEGMCKIRLNLLMMLWSHGELQGMRKIRLKLRTEDRNPLGSHEGVAENKLDMKVEDKLREKDKKRRDDRSRDFGEWDKDRNEHRDLKNALRQQRFVREVTIQYNLYNEPWLKYNINIVADKGLKKPLYTSARLKKGEVLYLETHNSRYELCFTGEKTVCNGTTSTSSQLLESEQEKQQNHPVQNGDKHSSERENIIDVYRWSRCKNPLPQDVMHSKGIPLPIENLEVFFIIGVIPRILLFM